MLIAFSLYLKKSDKKRKLLITSLSDADVQQILVSNGIECCKPYIATTGYVPSEDLPYLYNDAFAFLFASLREGFGIPLLEAMACGTPVITSNTSSMPEVGGPDAILVNPENSDEIANMMLRLETDDTFYQEKRNMGLERAKLFSWRKTAEKLHQLYHTIKYCMASCEPVVFSR